MIQFLQTEKMVKVRYRYGGSWSHFNVWPRSSTIPKEITLPTLYHCKLRLKSFKISDLKKLKKFVVKEESIAFYDELLSAPAKESKPVSTPAASTSATASTSSTGEAEGQKQDEDVLYTLVDTDLSDNSSGESDIE